MEDKLHEYMRRSADRGMDAYCGKISGIAEIFRSCYPRYKVSDEERGPMEFRFVEKPVDWSAPTLFGRNIGG